MKEEKDMQEKTKELGEKIQSLGCLLTVLFTIPLILTIFLGIPGSIIGFILIVFFFIAKKKGDADN